MKQLCAALACLAFLVTLACQGEGPTEAFEATGPGVQSVASAPQFLFGHDNNSGNIVEINTSTGLGTVVGPTGFGPADAGMAVSGAPVAAAGNVVYAAGTVFALLGSPTAAGDEVVVVNTQTGAVTPVVQPSRQIGARGIAFGADGKTLYLTDFGQLSTIDLQTGAVTLVGQQLDASSRQLDAVSLEFDPASGWFYGIDINTGGVPPGELASIDPATGSVTPVGNTSLTACTLVRSPAGDWFTEDGGALYQVDIATGAVTIVSGSSGLGRICGMAFAPRRAVTLAAEIDIKPGSDPNSINCRTGRNGVVPVALLTTDQFDATAVDHTTVRFGPGGAMETHANKHGMTRHEEDVDGDGDTDLVFHFRFAETGIQCGDTEATLEGETFGGMPFSGTDAVRTVGG